MKRLMLKAENQSFRLDRETGRLRIPIRGTEGVQMHLPLADWHRSILAVLSWGLGSLTVVPGKVILVVRKEAPQGGRRSHSAAEHIRAARRGVL